MGENDILTLFELVGVIGVDVREAIKSITQVQDAAKDATDGIDKRFKDLQRDLSTIDLSADVDVDEALKEIERFKQETKDLMKEIEADATIAVDSDQALRDLQRLKGQIERMEIKVETGDFHGDTSASRQQQRVIETMENITRNVRSTTTTSNTNDVRQTELIQRIARNIESVISGSESISTNATVEQTISSSSATGGASGSNSSATSESGGGISAGEIAAAVLAERALDGNGGNYGRYNRDTYNLDRSLAYQQAYQRKMLAYAQKLTANQVLPRVTQSLNMGTQAAPYFKDAKNAMQMQTAFGMIEGGVTGARSRLSQIGFGRTKTELKAVEGQLHMIANTRMDNLKDQIKLTEKALKEMNAAANKHEFANEIKEATEAMKKYKAEVESLKVAQKAAETEGFKTTKFAGKEVMYKEYKTTAEKIGGMMAQTVTRSIGKSMNETYNKLDQAGIDIVGDQGTKAENKAKITQLAGQMQMLGTTMMTVAPILGILAAGITMVGKSADEAASNLQRTQLLTDEETAKYREAMQRTSVATNSDLKDVSEVYQKLISEGYAGRYSTPLVERKAETGLNFEKAMGVDAMEAIKAVDKIKKKLGVNEDEAKNILASALKEYDGNLKKAEKEVLKHKKHWRDVKDNQIDGMEAYEKMTKGSETLWEKMAKAARAWGAALDAIWVQLKDVLGPILDKLQEIGLAAAEWLNQHPNVAKWIGIIAMLTAGFAALSAILLPVMSFLLMNRNVFQAIGQGLALMGKGTAIVNPQAKMLLDSMTRLRNGLLGMPRLIGALGPAFAGMLKGGPMALGNLVGTFIRLNPLLTLFGAIALLVFKNIDKYRPALDSIKESFERIIKAIAKAFGGDATTTTSAFNSIIQKLADVAATVLVPAFEAFAWVLEKVADWMENGGAEITVFIGKWFILATAIGGVLKGIGGLKGIFKVLFSPITKLIGMLTALKKLWPKGKLKAEVKTTGKVVPTTANTRDSVGNARIGTQNASIAKQNIKAGSVHVTGSPVYVNGKIAGVSSGKTTSKTGSGKTTSSRATTSSGRTGRTTPVPITTPKRNKPLRTPNGRRLPDVTPTPYVGSSPRTKSSRTTAPKAPRYRTTTTTHDEIPPAIRVNPNAPKPKRATSPRPIATTTSHDEIPPEIRVKPKNPKKPKTTRTADPNDPHSEIPDAIRVGGGKNKGKGKGKGLATGAIGTVLASAIGNNLIEALLDLNTKKAEKSMEKFLKDTQAKIDDLGGGGEDGDSLRSKIEDMLNGDLSDISMDGLKEIKEEISEEMKGIFGDDVFDKAKAKVPSKFAKFFGFVGKIISGAGRFLTGPIGAILLTVLPLLWEFREPIMKFLKKLGQNIPKWLSTGIKVGLKVLSKVGSWMAKPFKAVGGILKKVLGGISKIFSKVFNGIGKIVSKGLGKAARTATKLAKSIYKGATKGIKGISKFFGKIFKAVYKTVKKWMSSAAKTAVKLAKKIYSGIRKAIKGVSKFFTKIFKAVYRTVKKWMGSAAKTAIKLAKKLYNGVRKAISKVSKFFVKVFKAAYKAVRKWMGKAASTAVKLAKKIWTGIKKWLSKIGRFVAKVFKGVYNTIKKWLQKAWEKVKEIWKAIWTFISNIVKKIWAVIKKYFKLIYETVRDWLKKVWDKVKEIWEAIKTFIVDTVKKIWEEIKKYFRRMYESIKKWLGKIWDIIVETFGAIKDYLIQLAKDVFELGVNIIQGIWEGMKSVASSVLDWIRSLASDIAEAFAEAMGIFSPSRVMKKIARWIPIGVQKGIEDTAPQAIWAAKEMAKGVTKTVKTNMKADDVMNSVINSAGGGYSLTRATASKVKSTGSAKTTGINVQHMTVNNNTERASKAFSTNPAARLDREVRRKKR